MSTFTTNAESFTRTGIATLLVRLFSETQKRHDEALETAAWCFRQSERYIRFSKVGQS